MPTFEVEFRPSAAKAFAKLGTVEKRQLARKLAERRESPRVAADRVRHIPDSYRLKLRAAGIRLVYQVQDAKLLILVLSVGKREREEAYDDAIREFCKLSQ